MLLSALIGTLEQGLVYGIMALGVYITYRILHFADLTVDGSFPLVAAVAARFIAAGGSPLMGTVLAMAAGILAGQTTGFLNTKLKISGLLSGILTMTALYSVNLRIMGRANIPLLKETGTRQLVWERGMAPWVLFLHHPGVNQDIAGPFSQDRNRLCHPGNRRQ